MKAGFIFFLLIKILLICPVVISDGSHTVALHGGEKVAYEGRKSTKVTNALFLMTVMYFH